MSRQQYLMDPFRSEGVRLSILNVTPRPGLSEMQAFYGCFASRGKCANVGRPIHEAYGLVYIPGIQAKAKICDLFLHNIPSA